MKIVITVRDGCIEGVWANGRNTTVEILDADDILDEIDNEDYVDFETQLKRAIDGLGQVY